MSAQSPELQMKIQEWRTKSRNNEMTLEEYKEVIAALRKDRGAVTQSTAGSTVTKTRKAAAKKPDGDALLDELDNL